MCKNNILHFSTKFYILKWKTNTATLFKLFKFFCFGCSEPEKDLQSDSRGQKWWGEDECFCTHSGNDYICSVCQWWMWLWDGLWAWDRPVLLRLSSKISNISSKALHKVTRKVHYYAVFRLTSKHVIWMWI